MFLRKIELLGFKSFADKTAIVFDQGVTAIVGPNGCGKSNISDSIRWVLGERSAKMLRGSNMSDLIFAGTDYRKPTGLCEVSLTFDNSRHLFPVEYEEVVLTRRLYKSGDTEYLINKTPCRYKDIQSLILDTGIGSSAYSMIEQGRIDYIIAAKPEERRFLIEEAAGISKYKVSKEEALRKLARTEDNLTRLNDIVTEVERNIKYAERQAKRAEKFKIQHDELKELESLHALRELEHIDEEKKSIENENQQISAKTGSASDEVRSKKAQLSDFDQQVNEFDNEFSLIEEKRYHCKSELTAAKDQLSHNREKIQELHQTIQSCDEQTANAQEKVKNIERSIEEKTQEINRFLSEFQNIEEIVKQEREKLNAVTAERDQIQASAKQLSTQMYELSSKEADITNELNRIHLFKSNSLSTVEKTEKRKAELSDAVAHLKEQNTQAKNELTQLDVQLNECQSAITSLEANKARLIARITEIDAKIIQLMGQASTARSQINVLKKHGDKNQLNSAHQVLLAESSKSDSPIYGLLQSLEDKYTVQPGYEKAAEAALANTICGLICSSVPSAQRIVEFVKKSNIDSALLLIQSEESSVSSPQNHSDFSTPLIDFVRAENGVINILNKLLANCFFVEDLNIVPSEFWSKSGITFVDSYGSTLANGKVFIQGCLHEAGSADEGSLDDLAHQLEDSEQGITMLEGSKLETQSLLDNALNTLYQKEKQLQEIQKKHIEATHRLKSNATTLESFERELVSLNSEIEQHKQRLGKSSESEQSCQKQFEQIKQSLATIKESQQRAEGELSSVNSHRETQVMHMAEVEGRFKHFQDRRIFMEQGLEDQKTFLNREQEIIQIRQNEKEASLAKIKMLTEENQGLEEKERKLSLGFDQISEEVVEKKAYRLNLMNKRNELASTLSDLQQQLDNIKEKEHELHLKQMDLNYKATAIHERLLQTYRISLEGIDKDALGSKHRDLSNESLQEKLADLQNKVEAIGTVNLLAVEEYEELKNRYEFLTGQRQDIHTAKEQLLEAIRKINRTTRRLFEDTFNQVRSNFQQYYEILFGGGKAELVLQDESNPLESGIEIFVRPPGKKLQNITLLSGGEKALTATALLFALFKIKPSPFSVLDEIDAPLDEANIDRFLAVLKQFTDSSQFIIVTHNRKTIAMSDSLYGVTMEEPGVSKIVSVRVGDETVQGQKKPKKDEASEEIVVN